MCDRLPIPPLHPLKRDGARESLESGLSYNLFAVHVFLVPRPFVSFGQVVFETTLH